MPVRTVARTSVVALLAVTLVTGGALLLRPADPAPPAAVPAAATRASGEQQRLEDTVRRLPGHYRAWTALGFLHLERARASGDPAGYPAAERAFTQALRAEPGFTDALTGQGALAAARHDFPLALRLADRALAANAYDAAAHGVRADALTELGRYDEATRAVQRMLDLRPGADALARASYVRELRGDLDGARAAMQRAQQTASTPAAVAFAEQHLGDLALIGGNLTAALRAYTAALSADREHLPSLIGRARVAAARGDTAAALADLRSVVERQPLPEAVALLGELLEASGQREQAEQQYAVLRATTALAGSAGVAPDADTAVHEADHGDPQAALRLAHRLYQQRPDAVFAADAMAWALHRTGRSREALPIARSAVRLGTRTPRLWFHLGSIAAAAGDEALARTALRRALDGKAALGPLDAATTQRLLAAPQ